MRLNQAVLPALALVFSVICAQGCAPGSAQGGATDPGLESLLEGQAAADPTGATVRKRPGATVLFAAGAGMLGEHISYDLPQRGVDLRGFWTRPDGGVPQGSWAEFAAYAIEKPAGGSLRIVTDRRDLSLYIKQVGALQGYAYDGGELFLQTVDAARYVVLVAPSGMLSGTGDVVFDLTTEFLEVQQLHQ